MIIKRARGYRLYSDKGQKILDLSMDRGRAVLGHRPNGLSLTIKNVIERGLYARYNNIYIKRLEKELLSRFNEYSFVTLLEYEEKLKDYTEAQIVDPLFETVESCYISYWRPFLEYPKCEVLVLLYPLPGLNSTTVILSKKELTVKNDLISPVIISGILRSMYDYDIELKKFKADFYNDYRTIPNTELKPPYIVFNLEDEDYYNLIKKCENSGILLNDRDKIGVLSNDYSSGEIAKIVKTLS
ncbi:hypothetical protein EW093_11885 [Thiospirochaeta perfilievii]|uniref:Aminotransferase class III-fold pyridoxal phosphate-dependent enzyme n=1 Tax=Thiospirochaeta perfilievii TaxID=252967 RepID=A0A5C1QCU7_9SPIO|nr:hypothetical protein [Thiospirochaeta perfilievii]QEN05381.1 hypothetical protein EW093_11885 [Thiospirochaeta perfilievii]